MFTTSPSTRPGPRRSGPPSAGWKRRAAVVALAGGLALVAAGPASAKPPPQPVKLQSSQLAAACARLHGALFPPEMCVLQDGRVIYCVPRTQHCTIDALTTPAPARPEVTGATKAAVAAAG